MEEINLHESSSIGATGSMDNMMGNPKSGSKSDPGAENGAPVFADDGRVQKVFFSSLTPNQEVDSAGLNNMCLCALWALFSLVMNTRWNFISNFLFFAGNVCYVWISVNDLHFDDTGVYDDDLFNLLNFSGAILFLLNPVSDFLANWAENKATEINESLHDAEISLGRNGKTNGEPPQSVDNSDHDRVSAKRVCLETAEVDWNKWVAILFFLGSVLYLWQAFLDAYDEDAAYYDALDLIASHVFLLDSIFAIVAWHVGRQQDVGTSRQRWICALRPGYLDWSGWGDFLFLGGSVLDAAVSYMHEPLFSSRTIHTLELISNALWMVDALLYSIGYCFGQDLRRKFGNGEYTSLSHVEEEDEEYTSSSQMDTGLRAIELT